MDPLEVKIPKKRGRPRKYLTAQAVLLSATRYSMFATCFLLSKQDACSTAAYRDIVENNPTTGMLAAQLNFAYRLDMEEGEVCEEVTVQLSTVEALRSPDRVRWLEAIDREKLKLESFQTWRSLSESEMKPLDKRQVLPIALVLTRKRDQSFKCRAVILGNRQPDTGELDVFSPVVGLGTVRYLMTEATHGGDFLCAFDISNAFVQADVIVKESVVVKLPESWVKDNDNAYRKLLNALYGLRQSPRTWHDEFGAQLIKWGWEKSEEGHCLYKLPSKIHTGKYLKLAVYVDDCVISGQYTGSFYYGNVEALEVVRPPQSEAQRYPPPTTRIRPRKTATISKKCRYGIKIKKIPAAPSEDLCTPTSKCDARRHQTSGKKLWTYRITFKLWAFHPHTPPPTTALRLPVRPQTETTDPTPPIAPSDPKTQNRKKTKSYYPKPSAIAPRN